MSAKEQGYIRANFHVGPEESAIDAVDFIKSTIPPYSCSLCMCSGNIGMMKCSQYASRMPDGKTFNFDITCDTCDDSVMVKLFCIDKA